MRLFLLMALKVMPSAAAAHSECSGGKEVLDIRYQTVKTVLDPFADTRVITVQLLEHQRQHAMAELQTRQCLSGPHKDDLEVLLDGLSMEEILRADPDFIFISTMGKESAAKAHMEEVLSQPVWQSLTAVKNGRVIYLPKDLFQFKPNARWGDAYAYLIEVFYGA